jgi:hypothetical protein
MNDVMMDGIYFGHVYIDIFVDLGGLFKLAGYAESLFGIQ